MYSDYAKIMEKASLASVNTYILARFVSQLPSLKTLAISSEELRYDAIVKRLKPNTLEILCMEIYDSFRGDREEDYDSYEDIEESFGIFDLDNILKIKNSQ